mgnify:CR=1 FL=1
MYGYRAEDKAVTYTEQSYFGGTRGAELINEGLFVAG